MTALPDRDKLVEDLARAFHDEYEVQAAQEGWETQKASRITFEELPAENRETMLSTVRNLLSRGLITSPSALLSDEACRAGALALSETCSEGDIVEVRHEIEAALKAVKQ
jgi:hypothetical protein